MRSTLDRTKACQKCGTSWEAPVGVCPECGMPLAVAAVEAILRDPVWGLGDVSHEPLARALVKAVQEVT